MATKKQAAGNKATKKKAAGDGQQGDGKAAKKDAGKLLSETTTLQKKLQEIQKQLDETAKALKKAQSGKDVDTKKLNDLDRRREQMFAMLQKMLNAYNKTAKGIIQSIGR